MMKGIYLYMTMCIAAIVFTACTNELEENTVPTDNALVLTVGGFPAFQETPETRVVGTFDPGKTEWASGDKVLVRVSSNGSTTQYATLTYENNTWTANTTLTRPEGTFTVEAWYAPTYSWDSNGNMTTSAAGTGEFLHQTLANQSQRNIEINFSSVSRNYSRLRIAGSPRTNLSVSLTNFTPAGDSTAPNSYALTTDSKGNAYLYGTWTGSSNLDVTYGSTSLVNKNITTASEANTSYVVDASFTNVSNANSWNSIGDGTADCPYILLNGTQFKNFADKGTKSAQYKMAADIDLSTYTDWTPISDDFTGTFDGNNYAIKNLTRTTFESGLQFGLFSQNNGVIKNLQIEDCKIVYTGSSNTWCAAIAYWNYGTIENCHVNGEIQAYTNATSIAIINEGNIIACSNSAKISVTTSNSYVGGICGTCQGTSSSIIASYNIGDVIGSNIGGLVGQINTTSTATISSCFTTSGNICKEIAPFGTVNITNCYYLNGSAITNQDGGTVTDWQAATEAMNAQLGSYSYRYVQRNGTNQPPVIEATEQSQ